MLLICGSSKVDNYVNIEDIIAKSIIDKCVFYK